MLSTSITDTSFDSDSASKVDGSFDVVDVGGSKVGSCAPERDVDERSMWMNHWMDILLVNWVGCVERKQLFIPQH